MTEKVNNSSERIKIFLDQLATTIVDISPSTQGDEIMKKLGDKFKGSTESSVERSIFIALYDPKTIPLEKQVLRKISPEDHLAQIYLDLKKGRIPHDFFALQQFQSEKVEEHAKQEYTKDFFQKGKWDRVGDLLKGSEKCFDKSIDAKVAYSQKKFYLSKDVLYYLSLDKTFEVNAVLLQNAKFNVEKDPRDNKQVMKMEIPPSQVITLRSNDNGDFKAWYTSIYYATKNAHCKKKIDDFSKAIDKLESEVSKNDRSEITGYFYTVDTLFKGEESRSIIFDHLVSHQPQYKYLNHLQNNIKSYNSMIQQQRYIEAFVFVHLNYKLLYSFNLSDTEEDKYAEADQKDSRDLLREHMDNQYLEDDVKDLMKSIVTEELTVKMKEIIEVGEKDGPIVALSGGKGTQLFQELETNIYTKIKAAFEEVKTIDYDSKLEMESKLLSIPTNKLRKSLRWSQPFAPFAEERKFLKSTSIPKVFPNALANRQEGRTPIRISNSVCIRSGANSLSNESKISSYNQ